MSALDEIRELLVTANEGGGTMRADEESYGRLRPGFSVIVNDTGKTIKVWTQQEMAELRSSLAEEDDTH